MTTAPDLNHSEGALPFDGLGELRDPTQDTRRTMERRSDQPGRRPRDYAALRSMYLQAVVGVISGLTAMVSASWALFHPPITRLASGACGDGFGGQYVVRRGLSWFWFPAIIAMVVAVTLPDRKKRPTLILFCAGLVLGMGAGALLRVESRLIGNCLA